MLKEQAHLESRDETQHMTMDITLAILYHDPQGRLYDQIVRQLPALTNIFGGLAVRASAIASPKSLERFAAAGARIQQESPHDATRGPEIGQARREALELALRLDHPFILYCDGDRALHWADRYPQELAQVAATIPQHDFTVLGRTQRAFDSHPRTQRDTEAIINHVFAQVSGKAWDVTAGARGVSRQAAQTILDQCPDQAISTDVSWPLCLLRAGGFSLGHLATEGLEFETADRHGEEVARAGGAEQWKNRLDADPRRWVERLDLARVEVEAMVAYHPLT